MYLMNSMTWHTGIIIKHIYNMAPSDVESLMSSAFFLFLQWQDANIYDKLQCRLDVKGSVHALCSVM